MLSGNDVRELLRAGFLRQTDLCWTETNPEPRPLSTMIDIRPGGAGGWLEWARVSVSSTGKTVQRQTTKLLKTASAAARRPQTALAKPVSRLLEDYVPRLRDLANAQLKDRFFTAAKSTMQDEPFLRRLFGAVYDCLPKPVRRFVAEEKFVAFCLERRRQLLE